MTIVVLDSSARDTGSTLVEPTWKLPSNVPSGKLTVEQFNWNDDLYSPSHPTWKLIDHIPPGASNWFVRADNLGNITGSPPSAAGSINSLDSVFTLGGSMESNCSGYDQIMIKTVNNYDPTHEIDASLGGGAIGGDAPNPPGPAWWIFSKSERDRIVTTTSDNILNLLAAYNGDTQVFKTMSASIERPFISFPGTTLATNRSFYNENNVTVHISALHFGMQIWIRNTNTYNLASPLLIHHNPSVGRIDYFNRSSGTDSRSLAMMLPRGYAEEKIDWIKVRHVPSGTTWFASDDDLFGTDAAAGDPTDDSAFWNLGVFESILPGYDEIKIETGNGVYFAHFKRKVMEDTRLLSPDQNRLFDAIATWNGEIQLGMGDFTSTNHPTIWTASNLSGLHAYDPVCYYAEGSSTQYDKTALTGQGGIDVYIRRYYTKTQGSYTSSLPLEGVEKQSDGQVGFKFEKADGTALTESELPSRYALMCHVTKGEGY